MKLSTTYFLFSLALCVLAGAEVSAQESTYPAMEETESPVSEDRDDVQYIPAERERNQYIPASEPVRNGGYNDATNDASSTSAKSSPANEKQGEKNETDDSVLGFNFLYYIIQKFKMSEIVDK